MIDTVSFINAIVTLEKKNPFPYTTDVRAFEVESLLGRRDSLLGLRSALFCERSSATVGRGIAALSQWLKFKKPITIWVFPKIVGTPKTP